MMYKPITLPDSVIGLTVLDKSKFKASPTVPSVLLTNPFTFNEEISRLKHMLLKLPQFKSVLETDLGKRVLLDPENCRDVRHYIVEPVEVHLTYENFPSDMILQKVLSKTDSSHAGNVSFSLIGHILHLNLREHLEPFKKLIGEVLLDKNKNVKVVVNKTTKIDSTFRNFHFEILAGEGDTIVRVKEHGCIFEFDFAKVYWNPRLATEHDRIANLLSKKSALFDIFAGVGPFAVPAARKGCSVYANDLNPASFEGLLKNLKLNKVQNKVEAFNLDGREFLTKVLPEKIQKHLNDEIHITMNLPALAVEFLDVFEKIPISHEVKMTVHCYLFVKCDQRERGEALWRLVGQHLGNGGSTFTMETKQEHYVRSVAPAKDMMRATFTLRFFGNQKKEGDEPQCKKAKQ